MMTGPDILRSDVNVIVESALQAMRHVASAVDEARRRQDISIQSSLIVSRISMAPPLPSQAASPPQTLTSAFLTSLGACLLAGSLDVMHYPASGDTVKAKYLGAFLYMGGYLVLVKVCKGKAYEPRHWFSLADFELVDLEEDDGVYPFFFLMLAVARYSMLSFHGYQPCYPAHSGCPPRTTILSWRLHVGVRRRRGCLPCENRGPLHLLGATNRCPVCKWIEGARPSFPISTTNHTKCFIVYPRFSPFRS
jgi:hypothetical protein